MEKITEEELAAGKEKLRRAFIDAAILREKKAAAEADEEAELEDLDLLLYKAFENFPKDIDPSGTPISPGHPEFCMGNGDRTVFECCCDNCDFFLRCFPEFQKKLT